MRNTNSDVLKRLCRKISDASEIAISGHVNPDGDSIGSLLALGLGLEAFGKKVYMISPDPVPRRYRALPGAARVIRTLEKPVDLAISVDCSSREILGPAYTVFENASSVIEIDHHDYRRPFGDIAFLDKKAAAVGEMVYQLLEALGVRIDKDIAQNIITSIIVETSSFRLPSVRPVTFEICSVLMDRGVDFYKLVDMVFWSQRRESIILSGICLSRCKFIVNGKIVWSIITRKDLEKVHGTDEDVDAVPDEMRSISTIKAAVLFREKDASTLRVSLRSRGRINVAAVAEKYNGGGHYDVAGCNIPNNKVAIKQFLAQVKAVL